MKPLSILCLAGFAATLALPAQADFPPAAGGAPGAMPPPSRTMPGPPPGGHEPLFAGLQLSDAQEDRLFELQHAQMPTLRKLEQARRQAEEALAELAWEGKFDEARGKQLAERVATTTAELSLLRARLQHARLQVLTPEQRARLTQKPPRPEGMERPPRER